MLNIFLNHGDTNDANEHGSAADRAPKFHTVDAYPGESLASITSRAYGRNTPELRARILHANANLRGTIHAPH